VSVQQNIIDRALSEHNEKVERAILMAVLNGYHTADMACTDVRMANSDEFSSLILGKGGVLIERVSTILPFPVR